MLTITPDFVTETVAPTAEPITRTEAKLHCRISITEDDALVDGMIIASRQYCESYTGRAFCRRTYRADITGFGDIMLLPYVPIVSITSIKYYDTASPSVLTTFAASNYQLQRNRVWRVQGASWPAVYPRPDAVQITYLSGYPPTSSPEVEAENVPQSVKQAMYLLIDDMNQNRGSKFIGPGWTITENSTVMNLLNFYRVYT